MPQRRRAAGKTASTLPGSPFLTHVSLKPDRVIAGEYPFTIPWLIAPEFELQFKTAVTFLVGENGSGKSTLLEALAWRLGFNAQGGNKDQSFAEDADGRVLGGALQLAWRQRVSDGFFLRAETFFNFATYLEEAGSSFGRYGGRPFHQQSHGEAFLSLFENRLEDGVYLLDEPEAALSPQRQLAFLTILNHLSEAKVAQFIIATHSPMLITLPGATILNLDGETLRPVDYWQTEHFQITKDFLNAPQRYFRHLFDEGPADDLDDA